MARYLYGNIKRGLINMHINIRSLYNKMGEIKSLVAREKPHILGISECELNIKKHNLMFLKVPGYEMVLPKSWKIKGVARVLVYVKRTLEFQQISDLEDDEIQTIWLKTSFKNSKKVFFSHQYREHTSTLGNTLAAQRSALDKMLLQWETAKMFGGQVEPNEVHVMGDMNIDCLNDRWVDKKYSLSSLGRTVVDFCNSHNFVQLVK